MKWLLDEKAKKRSAIVVEQSLCGSELIEIILLKHHKMKKSDKDKHTVYRALLGSIKWLQ